MQEVDVVGNDGAWLLCGESGSFLMENIRWDRLILSQIEQMDVSYVLYSEEEDGL